MSRDNICVICDGKKTYLGHPCTFCNGTGEWNDAASAYVKNHICQCISLDRKFCPVCMKECHHNSSQTPKQTIDPGYGGQSSTIRLTSNESIITSTDSLEEIKVLTSQ